MSAAHIVPLSNVPDKDAVKQGRNCTSAGALSQVCSGLPAVTTIDNNGTLRFQILDNCFG